MAWRLSNQVLTLPEAAPLVIAGAMHPMLRGVIFMNSLNKNNKAKHIYTERYSPMNIYGIFGRKLFRSIHMYSR